MSSLFNYELDEKNIRTTLQNARQSAFSDAAWNEFEENFSKKLHKPSSTSFIKLPDIHLNINRNVILPLFFILALVGVSAIMLSFIDFKSSDKPEAEKKLEPNANNYKGPPIVSVATIKQEKPSAPEKVISTVKKDSVITQSPSQLTVAAAVNNSVAVNTNTVVIKPAEVVQQQISTIKQTEIANNQQRILTPIFTPTAQNVYHRGRRKKAEKVPEEQMETIKAPTLIKAETETSEPELEIKID